MGHGVVVYAESLEQAIEAYTEHIEEPAPTEGWEIIPDDSIAASQELIGFGGLSEVYFDQIIKWLNIETPYVFDDVEDLLQGLHD